MTNNKESLTFDPGKEKVYLQRFGGELRSQQLQREISTSLAELLLSKYYHQYRLQKEELVDDETGINLKELSAENEIEVGVIKKIEKYFAGGEQLVVNISPENAELGYPDDMVDIWVKGEEKIKVFRFKVSGGWEALRDFEKIIGGNSQNNEEMLANPIVVRNYKMAELITFLKLAKEKSGVSIKMIEAVVSGLAGRFEKEFGEELFVDSELITRLWLACRFEIEKQAREEPVVRRNSIDLLMPRMIDYLYGQLKVTKTVGGGCGGLSLRGEFGKGVVVVKNSDGTFSFREGKTDGLTYCSKCGCWYSGDKCPICN